MRKQENTCAVGWPRIFAMVVLTAGSLLAQAPGVPTRSELDHFRQMFMNIANLDDSAADLQRREQTIIAQFRLNDAQAKALHAVGQEVRGMLVQIRTAALSAWAARGGNLSDADRARLNQMAADRDQAVLTLAKRLLTEIGPEAAERMRAPLNW